MADKPYIKSNPHMHPHGSGKPGASPTKPNKPPPPAGGMLPTRPLIIPIYIKK